MKKLLFYLFILCSTSAAAQNGTTFEVEQLSKPEKLHPVASPDEQYDVSSVYRKAEYSIYCCHWFWYVPDPFMYGI